jgi:hypothetical protein
LQAVTLVQGNLEIDGKTILSSAFNSIVGIPEANMVISGNQINEVGGARSFAIIIG